jgi:serpin B
MLEELEMKIRSRIAHSPVLVLALSAGCGRAVIDLESRHSADDRAANSGALQAQEGAAAANRFALSLLDQLDHRSDASAGNTAFAPTSLSAALMMVAAGAARDTRSGIITGLGFAADTKDPVSATASVLRQVTISDGSPTKVVAADRTWSQKGLTLQPGYLAALQANFAGEPGSADFRAEPEAARADLNTWVAEHTDGLVKELFAPGAITVATRLVAADAMVIDAPWKAPFDPAWTSGRPFTTPSGVITVPTMRQVGEFAHLTGLGLDAVELPFAGDRFALDLIAPGEGSLFLPLGAVADVLDGLAANKSVAESVAVQVPVFSTATALRLDKELKQLGMEKAFSQQADFTGMTSAEPLALGGVYQQVAVEVNERGTRAGIASGAVVQHRVSRPSPLEMHFDRPFVYIVRDRITGAFLVVGRIADPTKT